MLRFILSNDRHAGTFYISMRSDKPAGMMSGKKDGQGITVNKASFTLKIVHFLKRHHVLADLCNHTGLEVSFHWVEMGKSMSHRIFSFFYPG